MPTASKTLTVATSYPLSVRRSLAAPVAGRRGDASSPGTGLVGGDLEQTIREWHIALRFDPDNPKVVNALNKVQRELASSKELP